jgi:prepilin-type processing-associated H-X9-DG protein
VVELLICIGVIGLLAALLIPAVSNARAMASQAQCASNLRQWGMAVTMYVADYDNKWLPRRGTGTSPTPPNMIGHKDFWFNSLPRYVSLHPYGNMAAAGEIPQALGGTIWRCPSAEGINNSSGYVFTYAMNMALSPTIASLPDRYDKVGPTNTMVFMADSPGPFSSVIPYKSTGPTDDFNPSARHLGRANILFLDGHVASFEAAYLGCYAGDPHRPDVRWPWYVYGAPGAPWPGPGPGA